MSVMWNQLRAVDNRRNEILALVGTHGMPSDLFERYCGSQQEMLFLVNLGVVEIRKGRVYLTKSGKQRIAASGR